MQRILIVEDEQTLALALQESLKDKGFEVDVAREGETALQLFETRSYDVVVTDLKMPGMSGLELHAKIRKISPVTEVIIATAYGTMEAVIEALRLRAFDFIIKPYPVELLRDSIKRALECINNRTDRQSGEPAKPVHAAASGEGRFSVWWSSCPSEKVSYYFDLFNSGKKANLVYFEAERSLLRVKPDPLGEVRGFVRNGLFRRDTQARIKTDLAEYMREGYGDSAKWRLLIAEHDDKRDKLRLGWEGNQQHLLFSKRTGRAHVLLSHPGLKKAQGKCGDFEVPFSGGDSLLFLSKKMSDYINKRMGLMTFLSVVEACFRENGSDPAEKIRHAIDSDRDNPPPGILVVSARDSVEFTDHLSITVPAEQSNLPGMKYIAEQVCSQCGCSEEETFEIVTALNEALLNSMMHGYGSKAGETKVLFAREGGRLSIEVRDGGRGFVYRPSAREPEDSYDWVTRDDGRGISMMKKLMDEVSVSSSPGQGTIVKMTKYVSSDLGRGE